MKYDKKSEFSVVQEDTKEDVLSGVDYKSGDKSNYKSNDKGKVEQSSLEPSQPS